MGEQTIKLDIRGGSADLIIHEASMDGVEPREWLRLAVARYSIERTAQRDIDAHFPADAQLEYGIAIIAQDKETVRVFEYSPNMTDIRGTQVILIEEGPRK